MIRQLRVWYHITRLGSAAKLGSYFDRIFAYFILKRLDEEGLFEYLKNARAYGEILAHFGFEDNEYTRDVFDVLSSDKLKILLKEGEKYRNNRDEPIPTFEEVLAKTDSRYQGFANMATDLSRNIPVRMRGKPTEFTQGFEVPSRNMMENFDHLLSERFYRVVRDAAFGLLSGKDRNWLRGKKLLEVGCGSGRETAELWLHTKGETHITAIDPVESLVKLAEERFETYLNELDPDHPPLTEANRPVFKVASATQLPFEDRQFDAVFYCYVLHYVANARRAVHEFTRVMQPDGLAFGVNSMKPYWSRLVDLVVRSNEGSGGFFWQAEHKHWYAEKGFECEIVTPVCVFRAKGTGQREAVSKPAELKISVG
jgi:ubiquinone/menaquinone biosynthesis C-methylase UbiE